MKTTFCFPDYTAFLRQPPHAVAAVSGSEKYPDIRGEVAFFQTCDGVLVRALFGGLPSPKGACNSPVFAFHIHAGGSCTGTDTDPFADVNGHYNPHGCPHPYHAGDLPPLFGAGGKAFSVCLTNRFTLSEIIGKTVIVHASPDDFTTQPAGNAGTKIACGVIRKGMI